MPVSSIVWPTDQCQVAPHSATSFEVQFYVNLGNNNEDWMVDEISIDTVGSTGVGVFWNDDCEPFSWLHLSSLPTQGVPIDHIRGDCGLRRPSNSGHWGRLLFQWYVHSYDTVIHVQCSYKKPVFDNVRPRQPIDTGEFAHSNTIECAFRSFNLATDHTHLRITLRLYTFCQDDASDSVSVYIGDERIFHKQRLLAAECYAAGGWNDWTSGELCDVRSTGCGVNVHLTGFRPSCLRNPLE